MAGDPPASSRLLDGAAAVRRWWRERSAFSRLSLSTPPSPRPAPAKPRAAAASKTRRASAAASAAASEAVPHGEAEESKEEELSSFTAARQLLLLGALLVALGGALPVSYTHLTLPTKA